MLRRLFRTSPFFPEYGIVSLVCGRNKVSVPVGYSSLLFVVVRRDGALRVHATKSDIRPQK